MKIMVHNGQRTVMVQIIRLIMISSFATGTIDDELVVDGIINAKG